ncbi:MAG: ABC transporter permease [Propionibacteriales bacterium]|nr:ABC transporter permease [Propionibacteriales bacterium]
MSAAVVFVDRSIRLSMRNVESLLLAIVLPAMLMLMFTFVFGGAIDPAGGYLTYVVPGIIVLCAGYGASTTAIDVAEDLRTGTINRFRTMPIPAVTVLVGHVVASLARNLLATAVVLVVGLLMGFRPEAGLWGWLGALAVLAVHITAITALFAAVGLATGSPQAASGYTFIVMFLPYLSSGFVPLDTLPAWLRPVAEHQPMTAVIESVRLLLSGADPQAAPWMALAWFLGVIAVSAAWTGWLFPRKVLH